MYLDLSQPIEDVTGSRQRHKPLIHNFLLCHKRLRNPLDIVRYAVQLVKKNILTLHLQLPIFLPKKSKTIATGNKITLNKESPE